MAEAPKTMLEDPFQSNGLLGGTEMQEPEEPRTAREELEMMSSNGLLDASMEDTEVLRRLGGEGASAVAAAEGQPEEEADKMHTAEFSGNGLLFGGNDGTQRTEIPEQTKNAESTALAASTNAGASLPEPPAVQDEFQGNGILGGDLAMDDEPTPSGEAVTVPTLPSVTADDGFEANGLLGDPTPDSENLNPAADGPVVGKSTTPGAAEARAGGSSLDHLLDELDSAGYTAAEKGKARAEGAARRVPSRSAATPRPEAETPTTSADVFPGMNLVLQTDEAEKLQPLEAVDGRGRKLVFKRRPRKVVDGKGVSPSPGLGRARER